MTKINVGDKIMITNVAAIDTGGDEVWRDGDVEFVMEVNSLGLEVTASRIDVTDPEYDNGHGEPTLIILWEEVHAIAKMLQINAMRGIAAVNPDAHALLPITREEDDEDEEA